MFRAKGAQPEQRHGSGEQSMTPAGAVDGSFNLAPPPQLQERASAFHQKLRCVDSLESQLKHLGLTRRPSPSLPPSSFPRAAAALVSSPQG